MAPVLLGLALAFMVVPHEARAARLFTSGFETNNFLETEWSNLFGGPGPTIVTSPVHSGSYAINRAVDNQDVRRTLGVFPTSGSLFLRAFIRVKSYVSNKPEKRDVIIAGRSGPGNLSWELDLTSTGVPVLINGADNSTVTSSVALSLNTWYRVEIRQLLSTTVGELELRIDGVSQASLTGINTLNGGNMATYEFGSINGGDQNLYYDDIALNDNSGTFQNSWPGDGNIVLLKPTFNNVVAWTPNPAGSSNAPNVADEPGTPDDDTTYNSISDTVSQDKFYLSELIADVPGGAAMTLAQVFARAGSNQASADTIQLLWWNENDTQITGPTFSVAVNGYQIPKTSETLVVNLSTTTRQTVSAAKIGYQANSGASLLKKVTALWANVEYTGAAPTSGLQVSSRSDTLSDSRPSATSNNTFAFTINSAITASSTVQLTWPSGFLFSSALSCADVDVATGTQFALTATSVGCEATATAWGAAFLSSSRAFILTAPWTSGLYVATGTQITINIGSNATVGQQGAYWITNPSAAGTYTISVGGTFGGSGNMLVSINAGVTVQATVAESLALTVSSVKAVNCTADDGATVSAVDTSPTTVNFGTLSLNTFYAGCQDLVVSTNAGNGYSLTVQESSAMKTGDGRSTIADTTCDGGTCTESAAAAWTNATKNGLGHTCFNQDGNHDCNTVYTNGTSGKNFRQFANIAAGETAQAIMSSSTPASVTARVKYRLSAGLAQVAGAYATVITYIITGTY